MKFFVVERKCLGLVNIFVVDFEAFVVLEVFVIVICLKFFVVGWKTFGLPRRVCGQGISNGGWMKNKKNVHPLLL